MIARTRILLNISIRLLVIWLVLSVVGVLYADNIINLMLPYFEWVIKTFTEGYTPHLSIVNIKGQDMIGMSAITTQPIPIVPGYTIPVTSRMNAASHVIHTLVPVVILLTIVFAVPASNWRERLVSLPITILITALVIGVSTPFLLAGHIEILYHNLAMQHGYSRDEPFLLSWMVFVETGGRWILPIVASILVLWITRGLGAKLGWRKTTEASGGNDAVSRTIQPPA